VRLGTRDGLVTLEMVDEERGLPAEIVESLCAGRTIDIGDGLTAMRERLLQLGGRLEVHLAPDEGLVMTGLLPRHEAAH
jgi:signal transduction histidine kinase